MGEDLAGRVAGLSKVIALEGGEHGVTSNTVCPAYVRTPLVEKQIADQARVHGISAERVITDVVPDRAGHQAPDRARRGGRLRGLPLLRARLLRQRLVLGPGRRLVGPLTGPNIHMNVTFCLLFWVRRHIHVNSQPQTLPSPQVSLHPRAPSGSLRRCLPLASGPLLTP